MAAVKAAAHLGLLEWPAAIQAIAEPEHLLVLLWDLAQQRIHHPCQLSALRAVRDRLILGQHCILPGLLHTDNVVKRSYIAGLLAGSALRCHSAAPAPCTQLCALCMALNRLILGQHCILPSLLHAWSKVLAVHIARLRSVASLEACSAVGPPCVCLKSTRKCLSG